MCVALGQFVHHSTSQPGSRRARLYKLCQLRGVPWSENLDELWSASKEPRLFFAVKPAEQPPSGANTTSTSASKEPRLFFGDKPAEQPTSGANTTSTNKSESRAQSGGEPGVITFGVRLRGGEVLFFRARESTGIVHVENTVRERWGIPVGITLRLMLDGQNVRRYRTVGELGLEDGDELDAIIEQTGC